MYLEEMQLPEIFAANVKRLMAAQYPPWTQVRFAEALGINQSHVSTLIRGHIWPSAERIQKIASVFNVPVSELLSENPASNLAKPRAGETLYPVKEAGPSQVTRVPDLGWVGAGLRIDPMRETSEYIHATELGPGEYASFRVKGYSMVGHRIGDGDRVFVRRQPGAENGEMVVACIEGQYLLKVYRVKRGKVELHSADDDKTPPMQLDKFSPEDVQIIGVLVKWEGVAAKPRKRK